MLEAGRFTNTFGAPKRLPRLELILECAWWIIGDRAYELLAHHMRDAEPNDLHVLFAAHLAAGGTHVTVNLDGCIEDAYERATGRLPRSVVHRRRDVAAAPDLGGALTKLHGSVHRTNQPEDLGLFLHGIGCGFATGIERGLRDLLSRKALLVFAGYGGLDFIDVTPFFLALPAAGVDLRHLRVVWIEHRQHGRRDSILHDGRGILDALERCGAEVEYRADGRSTREHLRDLYAPALPLDPPPWPAQTWWDTPAVGVVTEGERQLIAAQIWSAMGAGAEATRAAASALPFFTWPPPADWDPGADGRYPNALRVQKILMNGLRDQGRYRSAAEHGRNLLASSPVDSFTRFVLTTRIAGDLWFGGDHAAAVALFDELVAWIEGALDAAAADRRWQSH
ncbi:MAG: SIR2 family protein, partial [Acidobacteriota bacterium]|nr:SIR2 family protein [Acidobacteriota bacterium]